MLLAIVDFIDPVPLLIASLLVLAFLLAEWFMLDRDSWTGK